jgi:uncharacterized membrane protein YfcA
MPAFIADLLDLGATLLSARTLAVLWIGALAGGFASGAAGFAYGVVATAIWLHAIEPLHATMLVVTGGMLIQGGMIWPLRRDIDVRRLAPFLVAGFAGIPIGVSLLVRVDAQALKVALGIFLAIYGGYALAAPRLPRITGGGRAADAGIGFAGGVLGGIGGLSGVLPAIWCQLRGWPKDVSRGVYQPFILAAHVATLSLISVVAIDRAGIFLMLVALPAVVAGAFVGWRIYGKLDERRFRLTFAGLLVVSGLILAI